MPKKHETKQDEIQSKKAEALEYYRELPSKKYAAAHVGRDQDTIRRWEIADPIFAEQMLKARSDYLLAKVKKVKPEFIIPLLFREFTPRQELTGENGQPVQFIIKSDGYRNPKQIGDDEAPNRSNRGSYQIQGPNMAQKMQEDDNGDI